MAKTKDNVEAILDTRENQQEDILIEIDLKVIGKNASKATAVFKLSVW